VDIELVKLIKGLPDPFVWINEFKQSYSQFKKDNELKEIANICIELSDALYKLERNPSYFMYGIVANKTLNELSDAELEDTEVLNKIEYEVDKFREDYQQVSNAFALVEMQAYKKLGNVIVELGRGLDKRRDLLNMLATIINKRERPEEIRKIGDIYLELITTIQPLREEIRCFVDKYK